MRGRQLFSEGMFDAMSVFVCCVVAFTLDFNNSLILYETDVAR